MLARGLGLRAWRAAPRQAPTWRALSSKGGGDDDGKAPPAPPLADPTASASTARSQPREDEPAAPAPRLTRAMNRPDDRSRGGRMQDFGASTKAPPRELGSTTRLQGSVPKHLTEFGGRLPEGYKEGSRLGVDLEEEENSWMTDELLDEFEAKIVLGHLQINKGLSKINPATGEPRAEEFSRDNYVPRTDTKSGYKFGQKPEEPEGEGAPEDMSYILKDRRNGSFIEPEEYDFMEHERARTKPSPLEQRLDPRAGDAKRRCNKNTKYHLINKDMADISNLPLLREFLTDNGLIEKRIAKRLKRARQMGIIPSTSTYTAHNLLGFPDKKHQALISKTI